ncbi:MAG: GspE/PulE family protein [Desulfurella sp.]
MLSDEDKKKINRLISYLQESNVVITILTLQEVIKDSQNPDKTIDYNSFFKKLTSTGIVTEELLTQALARLDDTEYYDYFLKKETIDKNIIQYFSKAYNIFKQFFFVPLEIEFNENKKEIHISFGMKNPNNKLHLSKIDEVLSLLFDCPPEYKNWQIVKHIYTISVSALEDYYFHFLQNITDDDLIKACENISINLVTTDDTERTRSVQDFLQKLIAKAVFEGVSDIHFEPSDDGKGRIKFRKNGILIPILSMRINQYANVLTALALNCSSEINHSSISAMDGRIEEKPEGNFGLLEMLKQNYNITNVDYRVSYIPNALNNTPMIANFSVVIRILSKRGGIPTLDQLGFTPIIKKEISYISEKAHGIFLITGPTGSGKSTTLYSILSRINATEKNIMTIEDPVEYKNSMWKQVQVNEKPLSDKEKITFANAIKHFLRHDPDVILLGEIRDPETAKQAVIASNTGHLVLSTLHTNDAPSAISRLLNLDVDVFDMVNSIIAILGQRLVRKVCPYCATKRHVKDVDRDWIATELKRSLGDIIKIDEYLSEIDEAYYANLDGCPKCHHTGYVTRTVISEICIINQTVKNAIINKNYDKIYQEMLNFYKYNTLLLSGFEKIRQGITTFDEVRRVI